MDTCTDSIAKIKALSLSFTKENYDITVKECLTLLTELHDQGMSKETVYQNLHEYYKSLDDGFNKDFIADILDFVSGWCSPQNQIWNDV